MRLQVPTPTKLPPAPIQANRRRRRPKPKSICFRSIPIPPARAVGFLFPEGKEGKRKEPRGLAGWRVGVVFAALIHRRP